jgi:hypothetical protein
VFFCFVFCHATENEETISEKHLGSGEHLWTPARGGGFRLKLKRRIPLKPLPILSSKVRAMVSNELVKKEKAAGHSSSGLFL